MSLIEVKVPDIGDFSGVDVIEVNVKPGDVIEKEQTLITLESDKASMEVPSDVAGTVKEVKVKAGEKVSQGTVIAIVEASAGAAAPAKAPEAAKPAAAAPAPVQSAAVAPAAPPVATAHDPNSPLGIWLTEEKEGKIRIEPCGTNLCGYAIDAKSKENREQVLINMRPGQSKVWSGRIFDPDSGSTYDSTIALKGPSSLRVQGCALGGMFCGGQTWTRVN